MRTSKEKDEFNKTFTRLDLLIYTVNTAVDSFINMSPEMDDVAFSWILSIPRTIVPIHVIPLQKRVDLLRQQANGAEGEYWSYLLTFTSSLLFQLNVNGFSKEDLIDYIDEANSAFAVPSASDEIPESATMDADLLGTVYQPGELTEILETNGWLIPFYLLALLPIRSLIEYNQRVRASATRKNNSAQQAGSQS